MLNKILKKAHKISIFLILLGMAFSMWSPSANAAFSVTTSNATTIKYNGATLNGFLTEPSLPITVWFELGTDASSLNLSTEQKYINNLSAVYDAPITGLNSNTTYYFRAVGQSYQGRVYGNILSFKTTFDQNYYNNNNGNPNYPGSKPGISTTGVTTITDTSAVLNGYVAGNNLGTTAWFEWGTNTNFTNSTTQNYYGFNPTNFSITLNGLKPNTLYYFRSVAQNTQGRVFGNVSSFTTIPSIYVNPITNNQYPLSSSLNATTLNATNVYSTSAQLNALITNIGTNPSNTYFEWGESGSLENKTKVISTGALPRVKHTHTITGLKPNTTYYFRAVAENDSMKSIGEITYFITGANTNTYVAPQNTQNNNISIITEEPANIQPLEIEGLGASVINTNFLPGNIFGWLFFAVLILLIILLIQHLFTPATSYQEHTSGHH